MAKKSAMSKSKPKKSSGKDKKSKTGPNKVEMKHKAAAAPKPNPFESIWSRTKFDILGKNRKGQQRRIGQVRSQAIDKRKSTLQKEYEQSTKSSVFVDKRIGEQNEDLEEFEKSILRSQRERQLKFKKKNKYNLSDGEDDDFGYDGGLSFPGKDDFEDDLPFDEVEDGIEDEKRHQRLTLSHLNTHEAPDALPSDLMDGLENKPKSKKEAMAELIQKSKFYKAQHAKEKEENEQIVDQLDKDFTSLVQSKAMFPLTQATKMNALKALTNINFPIDTIKKDDVAVDQTIAASDQEKHGSYDVLLSEMAQDIRARPSERTKTPEEIAQEEKERLEQLEEERKKRMVAADDSGDEDSDDPKDDLSTKCSRSISGDDLGDSFTVDEDRKKKLRWIDLMLQKTSEETDSEDASATSDDSDSTNDDDEDTKDEGSEEEEADENDDIPNEAQGLKDWEQSDDDVDIAKDQGCGDANLDAEDHKAVLPTKGGQLELLADKVKVGNHHPAKPDDDLPYTIEAPKTLEEFNSLVDNRSNDQIVESIRRIRTFNAIAVAAENRKKLQVFYGVLLQYFAILSNKKPLNLELLNMLVKPLMEMSNQFPYFATICARQRLHRTRTQLCDDLKDTGKSSWPSPKTLFLLRLWSMIFPCSDFRHPVLTPLNLLMSEYLTRCPIKSGKDVAVGSFLCSLILSVCKQSLKFFPEAIVFLQTVLTTALNEKDRPLLGCQLLHLMEIKAVGPWLHIQSSVKEINSLEFYSLMDMPEESPYFSSDSFRAGLLLSIIEILHGFVTIYDKMISFPELFLPFLKLLHDLIDQNDMPDALKHRIGEVAQLIQTRIEEHHKLRQPLRMRERKIEPIKLLDPKFVEEGYVKGRDYDPDRAKAEERKLKKHLKQEAKGARRELRKDNHFLFQVKQNKKALEDEDRVEKYGKARAFLQEQEHAFKSGQMGKNRKRRR